MALVMTHHQATLLTLVGRCVAGERDGAELAASLVQCGKMHARFGPLLREYVPQAGAAMLATLHGALGERFTPAVEAAWAGVFHMVATHLLEGLDCAELQMATEHTLREQLLGAPGLPYVHVAG
jgi:hemoglobin-like flavoprotein